MNHSNEHNKASVLMLVTNKGSYENPSVHSLVAKFISIKTIKYKVAESILAGSWNLIDKVSFTQLSHNVCLYTCIVWPHMHELLED